MRRYATSDAPLRLSSAERGRISGSRLDPEQQVEPDRGTSRRDDVYGNFDVSVHSLRVRADLMGRVDDRLGEKLFLESNTLTPILKKLEAMGHVERTRDPADERQVRVRLTKGGKRLREKALSVDLAGACGLTPKDFSRLQKEIVTLRNNLLKAVEAQE